MIEEQGSKEKFLSFKQKYYNNSLADQVLNKMEKQKIAESRIKLIQKAEPIYKLPEKNNGRAHFYAPVKRIIGIYIDTPTFNLCIIWIMTILLYLMVRYNTLKSIMVFLNKIKISFI